MNRGPQASKMEAKVLENLIGSNILMLCVTVCQLLYPYLEPYFLGFPLKKEHAHITSEVGEGAKKSLNFADIICACSQTTIL